MEFSPVVYGAALCLLFYYLLRSRSSKSKAPPHAGGTRLITGHLHLIQGDGLPHVNLATLADNYGPAFTIQLGVRRALVVSSRELAKQLFTTNDTAVSSHLPTKAAKYLGHGTAVFGYESYDSYPHELSKLVSSVDLLSSRRLELQREVRMSEIARFMKEIYKAWEKRRKDSSGVVRVDMKRRIEDLDLNVVLRTVAGKRLSGGEETRWRKVMRDFFRLMRVVVVGDAFPHFGWLDVGGYEKRMKETSTEMGKILGGWLAEHRRKEYSGPDFMDMLLSAVQDGSNLQGQRDVNDTIIKATCQSLIAAGSDTTTSMLVRTLSLVLKNREILKKAQEELEKHVGKERRVTESDINNLVYLQAIVKEAVRLYPATPLGGPREFTKSCNVGGYHVPKGTWLIVNLWKVQRDPQVWTEDPLQFRPERFLSRHKDYEELIPFCPETKFSLETLHLVLANMLQAFDFSDNIEQVDDMCEEQLHGNGMINSKDTPLDLLLAPRLSPNLY